MGYLASSRYPIQWPVPQDRTCCASKMLFCSSALQQVVIWSPPSLTFLTSDPLTSTVHFHAHNLLGPSCVNPGNGCASVKMVVDQQMVKPAGLAPAVTSFPFLPRSDAHFALQQVVFIPPPCGLAAVFVLTNNSTSY